MLQPSTPYQDYKRSGTSWLGDIPSHWEVRRNGRLFSQRNETSAGTLPILEVSLKTGVRIRDLEGGRKQVLSDRDKYKRAVKGDLAYNMMRMWQGAVGVAPADGLVSPAYVVARPLLGVDARYFSHLFRIPAYMNEVDGYSRGIVKDRNRLYWEDFKQMPSAYPPPDEQRVIVRFIEVVDLTINQFIRSKRRLISLLQQQSQAIITRAISRGINVDSIELKASGSPYLGDVPLDWTLKRFKFCVRVTSGQVDPSNPPYSDYFLVAPDHIEKWTGNILKFESARDQGAVSGKYIVQPGQVIYSKIRPALRKAAISPIECLCSADMYPLSPAPTELLPEYLLLILLSDRFTKYAEDCSLRVAMPKVNREALGEYLLSYPSLPDQQRILTWVRGETSTLITAIRRSEDEIRLIGEYRTRLISDVVTGKLDVRHVQLPNTDSIFDQPDACDIDDLPDDEPAHVDAEELELVDE